MIIIFVPVLLETADRIKMFFFSSHSIGEHWELFYSENYERISQLKMLGYPLLPPSPCSLHSMCYFKSLWRNCLRRIIESNASIDVLQYF